MSPADRYVCRYATPKRRICSSDDTAQLRGRREAGVRRAGRHRSPGRLVIGQWTSWRGPDAYVRSLRFRRTHSRQHRLSAAGGHSVRWRASRPTRQSRPRRISVWARERRSGARGAGWRRGASMRRVECQDGQRVCQACGVVAIADRLKSPCGQATTQHSHLDSAAPARHSPFATDLAVPGCSIRPTAAATATCNCTTKLAIHAARRSSRTPS